MPRRGRRPGRPSGPRRSERCARPGECSGRRLAAPYSASASQASTAPAFVRSGLWQPPVQSPSSALMVRQRDLVRSGRSPSRSSNGLGSRCPTTRRHRTQMRRRRSCLRSSTRCRADGAGRGMSPTRRPLVRPTTGLRSGGGSDVADLGLAALAVSAAAGFALWCGAVLAAMASGYGTPEGGLLPAIVAVTRFADPASAWPNPRQLPGPVAYWGSTVLVLTLCGLGVLVCARRWHRREGSGVPTV